MTDVTVGRLPKGTQSKCGGYHGNGGKSAQTHTCTPFSHGTTKMHNFPDVDTLRGLISLLARFSQQSLCTL